MRVKPALADHGKHHIAFRDPLIQDANGRCQGLNGPNADIGNRSFLTHNGYRDGCQFALQQTWSRLLDDLIGGHKQALWNFEAERLCGLEVDDKLELGRLHDR